MRSLAINIRSADGPTAVAGAIPRWKGASERAPGCPLERKPLTYVRLPTEGEVACE